MKKLLTLLLGRAEKVEDILARYNPTTELQAHAAKQADISVVQKTVADEATALMTAAKDEVNKAWRSIDRFKGLFD